MLSGQPPFTGPSFQAVIARHSLDPVPGLRVIRQTVSQAVEQAIAKAMAKLPADRFASMQQFMSALGSPDAATIPAATPARSRRVFTPTLNARVVGLFVTCALIAATWWIVTGRRTTYAHVGSGGVGSIAVLPFQELAAAPEGSYLADGMTEGLISDLAQIRSLKVISRASGTMADSARRSLPELASRLGADGIVNGSIRRTGDSVDVSVRFLRARDSTMLFSGSYRDRLGELPDVQRRITLGITRSIGAEVDGAERNRLSGRRAVDQRAYEGYLRGRFYLERGEFEPARLQFEQSLRVAPDWAPPYVGLAKYYTSLPFFSDVPPADVLPKARGALAHALELDPDLAEAHAANAYIRAYYEWDWRAAEQEFRRALDLRPNDADAYFSYSRFLASRRRLDEAIAQLGRAVELDPLSRSLQANRALLDYFAGRYDRAASRLKELLASDSGDATVKWGLALVDEQQGKAGEAVALLEPIATDNLNRKSSLGHAYALAGNVAKARLVLAALRHAAAKSYVPSYFFAVVYAGLGERGEALRYLERAYQERSTVLAYLLIDPRLAPLRTDPRFLELARRLGGD
jgi:TolB-like protein/lipoprotein NlpI